MTPEKLRAFVIGSGFAGQCHADALRRNGVEIVGMASRTDAVVREVADRMRIPHTSTDWRRSLVELQPDIVAVGAPGGVHVEMCVAAAEAGAHVYCDKPLATNAAGAKQIWVAASGAGVKTAYAASARYNPPVLHARELVADGMIGQVQEIECVSHYSWPKLIPFGWSHTLDQGGGRLNNNFTHKLSIVLSVLGDPAIIDVAGETRNDLKKAPVGPHVHDFRNLQSSALSPEEAAKAEWKDADSDWSYTVLTHMESAGPDLVSATFRHSCMRPSVGDDYVRFYGTEGLIHIDGAYASGDLWTCGMDGVKKSISTPQHILDSVPQIENQPLRNWTHLAREFVKDIRGEEHEPYLTFEDGWIFQEVIDAVRAGPGWRLIGQRSMSADHRTS